MNRYKRTPGPCLWNIVSWCDMVCEPWGPGLGVTGYGFLFKMKPLVYCAAAEYVSRTR